MAKNKHAIIFDQLNTIMQQLKPIQEVEKNIRPSNSLIQIRDRVDISNYNIFKTSQVLFYHQVLKRVTALPKYSEMIEFEIKDSEKHMQILEVFEMMKFFYIFEFLCSQSLQ